MKTLFLFSLPVGLLAASEAIPDGLIDPVARLGAIGVLGFVVIWHTTRTFPAIYKMHREDCEKWRQTLDDLKEAISQADRRG